MSTIHLHQTTTSTPEQFVAGLTDFGPGRSSSSATAPTTTSRSTTGGRLTPTSRKARAASGSASLRLVRSPPRRPDDHRLQHLGRPLRPHVHLHTASRGTTDVDVVVVREGKNLKGRFLALVVGTVGKGVW